MEFGFSWCPNKNIVEGAYHHPSIKSIQIASIIRVKRKKRKKTHYMQIFSSPTYKSKTKMVSLLFPLLFPSSNLLFSLYESSEKTQPMSFFFSSKLMDFNLCPPIVSYHCTSQLRSFVYHFRSRSWRGRTKLTHHLKSNSSVFLNY